MCWVGIGVVCLPNDSNLIYNLLFPCQTWTRRIVEYHKKNGNPKQLIREGKIFSLKEPKSLTMTCEPMQAHSHGYIFYPRSHPLGICKSPSPFSFLLLIQASCSLAFSPSFGMFSASFPFSDLNLT